MRICPHATVWAYGSRTTGQSHEGSDLDLAIQLPTAGESGLMHQLRCAFQESHLPFRVDLFELSQLPPEFQQAIQQHPIVLYAPLPKQE
jgi:uncharacterized protein